MKKSGEKSICIAELQNQILQWQGFKQVERKHDGLGLGELEQAFPGNVFPVGALHEFICGNKEEEAASSGFLGSLLSFLIQKDGVVLWISGRSEERRVGKEGRSRRSPWDCELRQYISASYTHSC